MKCKDWNSLGELKIKNQTVHVELIALYCYQLPFNLIMLLTAGCYLSSGLDVNSFFFSFLFCCCFARDLMLQCEGF